MAQIADARCFSVSRWAAVGSLHELPSTESYKPNRDRQDDRSSSQLNASSTRSATK